MNVIAKRWGRRGRRLGGGRVRVMAGVAQGPLSGSGRAARVRATLTMYPPHQTNLRQEGYTRPAGGSAPFHRKRPSGDSDGPCEGSPWARGGKRSGGDGTPLCGCERIRNYPAGGAVPRCPLSLNHVSTIGSSRRAAPYCCMATPIGLRADSSASIVPCKRRWIMRNLCAGRTGGVFPAAKGTTSAPLSAMGTHSVPSPSPTEGISTRCGFPTAISQRESNSMQHGRVERMRPEIGQRRGRVNRKGGGAAVCGAGIEGPSDARRSIWSVNCTRQPQAVCLPNLP